MANNLAVTGNVTVGGTLVVTGTTNLGAALDTNLVTNFNADKIDGADLSVDGTLAANSDVLVPSQKAVKTYADARKAECVALTGDQTVNGIKTLGSIPVLPASDPTTDNQAARKAYVDLLVVPLDKLMLGSLTGEDASPGSTVFVSADTVRSSLASAGSYTKIKEVVSPCGGTVTIDFDCAAPAGINGYFRIYVNGAAVGTERVWSSASWQTYSEDIAVSPSDLVQLYYKCASAGCAVRNFRLKVDSAPAVHIMIAKLCLVSLD